MKKLKMLLCTLITCIVAAIGVGGSTQAATKKMATASSGSTTYYAAGKTIYTINNSGTIKKLKTYTSVFDMGGLSYYKGYLYFTTDSSPFKHTYVRRYELATKKTTRLSIGKYVKLYNGKLYIIGDEKDKNGMSTYPLYSMNLNGTKKKKLCNASFQFIIYKDYIYYIAGKSLFRVNMNGQGKKKIASCIEFGDCCTDNIAVYYKSNQNTLVRFTNVSGTNSKKYKWNAGLFGVNNGVAYGAYRKSTYSKPVFQSYSVKTGKSKNILTTNSINYIRFINSKLILIDDFLGRYGLYDRKLISVTTDGKIKSSHLFNGSSTVSYF